MKLLDLVNERLTTKHGMPARSRQLIVLCAVLDAVLDSITRRLDALEARRG